MHCQPPSIRQCKPDTSITWCGPPVWGATESVCQRNMIFVKLTLVNQKITCVVLRCSNGVSRPEKHEICKTCQLRNTIFVKLTLVNQKITCLALRCINGVSRIKKHGTCETCLNKGNWTKTGTTYKLITCVVLTATGLISGPGCLPRYNQSLSFAFSKLIIYMHSNLTCLFQC